MKRKLVLLSLIFLLCSADVSAQKQTASAFVESFYKFHRARTRAFNEGEVKLHRKWFSPRLYDLFRNELQREKKFLKENPDDKPHFGDGFPFSPFEECSSGGKAFKNILKIGRVTKSANGTLVEVQFYQPKSCGGALIDAYKVEITPRKFEWAINDWIFGDGKRLSEDLKRAEY